MSELKKPLRPAQGAENNNGEGKNHEFLAKVIKTTEEDDSLAIQHSLLQDANLSSLLERRWGLYLAMWLPMMMLSVYVALKVFFYRLLARPRDKERMLLGPEKATIWFDCAHPLGYRVRNGVTTSAALDVIYSVPVALRQPRTIGERIIRFWLDQPDGQAVRNRLRLTYRSIREELERLYQTGQKRIRFLVLACGSAQASIEAATLFLSQHRDAQVELWLVDISQSSLRRAVRLAQFRGIGGSVQVAVENLKRYVGRQDKESWDLVEMVGFLDYRSWKSAVSICQEVRRLLRPGGRFVSAHIAPSPWAFVVRWVINWPLLCRRPPESFRQMLTQAGFGKEEITIEVEPNGIYSVSVASKGGNIE